MHRSSDLGMTFLQRCGDESNSEAPNFSNDGRIFDRSVRFTTDFFDDLDQQLAEARTDDGHPSQLDFLLYELPRLRDLFASDFEANTLAIDEIAHIRVMIPAGQLVGFTSLYAQLTADTQ
jgi:hypothetical protein